ncbi:MAG: hypothetical protein ACAI25_18975 [Planctomycetota bacterium]
MDHLGWLTFLLPGILAVGGTILLEKWSAIGERGPNPIFSDLRLYAPFVTLLLYVVGLASFGASMHLGLFGFVLGLGLGVGSTVLGLVAGHSMKLLLPTS